MTLSGISSHRALKSSIKRSIFLCLASFFYPVIPGLVNITVDDQLGDRTTGLIPEYLPNDGTWHVGSPTEECPTCKIKPSTLDLSQIHEQTWHDATHSPPLTPATATVRFSGSAVYVFNILPNTLFNTTTFVNITFSIDGEDTGTFTRSPDSSSTILYNQLVYRNLTLDDGPHILIMTTGASDDAKSLFLFDHLLYTTQSNDSSTSSNAPLISTAQPSVSSTPSSSPQSSFSSSSSTPVGAIVGGVVGGIGVLLGIAVAALLLRRRSLRSKPTRIEGLGGGIRNRGVEGEDENNGFLAQRSISTSVFPSEPGMRRSLDGVGTRNPYAYAMGFVRTGPDARSSLLDAVAASDPESPPTDQWSSKRHAELAQRLETLQRTRSILSSTGPPYGSSARSEVSSGGGTGTGIGELEAEIAELRGVLAALSARLAFNSESDGDRGPRESLPAYVE